MSKALLADDGLLGRYSGPEVRFEEIDIDVSQARFWITSVWPTNRTELVNILSNMLRAL
ncbi:MAG: hypothetical protein WBW01_02530 [Terriglobales bacterium]